MAAFLALNLILLIALTQSQQNQNCTLPNYQDLIIPPSKDYALRLYSNVNLSDPSDSSNAKHLIVVIHGGERDANDYYCAMFHAAQLQGYTVTNKDIIIVAPRFMQSQDTPNSNELYWSSNSDIGWRGCGNSEVPKNTANQVSSCGAVDYIIKLTTSRTSTYPNLKNITVVGHSAGGQFTQRYTLVSPIIDELDLNKYSINFVPANPSSFCYLDSRRWFNDEVYRELTQDEINACPGYNTWKYGWSADSKFPPYITDQNLTLDVVKEKYILKNVTYLHGTNDVCNEDINSTCSDGGMDHSCEGDYQGLFRLERGVNYLRSLMEIFGKPIHRIDFVPFVGHDHVDMFQHPNGRRAIF